MHTVPFFFWFRFVCVCAFFGGLETLRPFFFLLYSTTSPKTVVLFGVVSSFFFDGCVYRTSFWLIFKFMAATTAHGHIL